MLYWLLYLVPKKKMSRFVGWFASQQWPPRIQKYLNQQFAKRYLINEAESAKSFAEYSSLDELFTRHLKLGVRPIGVGPYVHPADSLWTQKGNVAEGLRLQFKSEIYSLERLLPGLDSSLYQRGQYGIYYLCPTDYHRVHSPVTGIIQQVTHVPGAFWPVNKWSTQNINELFVKNERVIIEILTDMGPVIVILVAATNVGQVSLAFDSSFRSLSLNKNSVWQSHYNKILVQKGQELGCFHMGSTVVVLTSSTFAAQFKWDVQQPPQPVKVGQSL